MNLIAESHNWFQTELKNILKMSFGLEMESQKTEILINKNSA